MKKDVKDEVASKKVEEATQETPKKKSKKGIDVQVQTNSGILENAANNFQKNFQEEKQVVSPPTNNPTKDSTIDVERVPWEELAKVGIKREQLEKSGVLDELLAYQKSSKLVPIAVPLPLETGDAKIYTDARLSFFKKADDSVGFRLYPIKSEPNLTQCYGHSFSEQERKNLLATGNAGTIINININSSQEKVPALASLDKLTNTVVATPVSKVRIPDSLLGVKFSVEQKADLLAGKMVFVEEMTSKQGKCFSAGVQYNADKRGFDFVFPERKQEQQQGQEKEMPKVLAGVDMSEYKEALKNGETVFVENMKRKDGEFFSALVKWDGDSSRYVFPSQKQQQSQSPETEVKQESKGAKMKM